MGTQAQRKLTAAVFFCLFGLVASSSFGQVNPVPFVNQPLVPTAVAPGGPGFTLTVNGTGFVPDSVVNWNGSPRPTTFVSNSQLTGDIPVADIASAGTASISVTSPPPGGGVSNRVFLPATYDSRGLVGPHLMVGHREGQ